MLFKKELFFMLASRGWSDGNVEFSARNAVYREQAKCEAFCGSSHFASKAMGARSREPRAKIFAAGEILPLHFILSPHQRC